MAKRPRIKSTKVATSTLGKTRVEKLRLLTKGEVNRMLFDINQQSA